jgi:hypothetical protein
MPAHPGSIQVRGEELNGSDRALLAAINNKFLFQELP